MPPRARAAEVAKREAQAVGAGIPRAAAARVALAAQKGRVWGAVVGEKQGSGEVATVVAPLERSWEAFMRENWRVRSAAARAKVPGRSEVGGGSAEVGPRGSAAVEGGARALTRAAVPGEVGDKADA